MQTCNCTLAGTEACLSCSNNIVITTSQWNLNDLTYVSGTRKTYNPETHDLVEKPEAKKARLEKELSELNKTIDHLEDRVNTTVEAITSRSEKVLEIEKQLKELE